MYGHYYKYNQGRGYILKSNCRNCKNDSLAVKFDLGTLKYTGVFPLRDEFAKEAPLRLAICSDCNFVQLYDKLDPSEFYKEGYGYESNLNSSMKIHLMESASNLENFYTQHVGNLTTVLDIASNDGTLLNGYKGKKVKKIGIDPIINFVNDKYPIGAIKIKEFFSSRALRSIESEPIDIVTSMSVFYDLQDPVDFAKQVNSILSANGIWYLEQSYLPYMINATSYDTICHEHLNYYSLTILNSIMVESGFKIINAATNSINGGSIAITVVKNENNLFPIDSNVNKLLEMEILGNYLGEEALVQFAQESVKHMHELKKLLTNYKNLGFNVFGLGASTKGNVMLQCAGIDNKLMNAIGEINPKKYGKFTPGTQIPIIDEKVILAGDPANTVIMLIPWHFKDSMLKYLESFISNGGKVIVPLPELEVISK